MSILLWLKIPPMAFYYMVNASCIFPVAITYKVSGDLDPSSQIPITFLASSLVF